MMCCSAHKAVIRHPVPKVKRREDPVLNTAVRGSLAVRTVLSPTDHHHQHTLQTYLLHSTWKSLSKTLQMSLESTALCCD